MRRKFTIILFFIIFFVVGLFWVEHIKSKFPSSMNMGMESMDMGTMNSQHSQEKLIPITSLVDHNTNSQVKTFDITAGISNIDLGKKEIKAWTFNGSAPGPEIHVQEGDRVQIHLTNKLPASTTIHWHGINVPASQDGVAGVTQNAIPPNGTFTYEFTANQPGTYWYHSHQQSAKQTERGLFGVLIVEPKQRTFSYDEDTAIALHEWSSGLFTLNQSSQNLKLDFKPKEKVRLRIINTGNRTKLIGMEGTSYQVIAMDGHDVTDPAPIENQLISIGAGQRFDLLFTVPNEGAKMVVGNFENKKLQPVSAVFGNMNKVVDDPKIMNYPTFDFTNYGTKRTDDGISLTSTFNREYELKLGSGLGFIDGRLDMLFKINGKTFPDIPSFLVKKGDLVKLHIINNSTDKDDAHPIHLHGHTFKVLAKNGKEILGSPVYLDTINVLPGENYDVAFVANNPGLWMLHCHNLAHAESGMSMMVNYEGISTPFTIGSRSGNYPD